jgi:hypothetical protein
MMIFFHSYQANKTELYQVIRRIQMCASGVGQLISQAILFLYQLVNRDYTYTNEQS